jgi:hypothetical protein
VGYGSALLNKLAGWMLAIGAAGDLAKNGGVSMEGLAAERRAWTGLATHNGNVLVLLTPRAIYISIEDEIPVFELRLQGA